MYGWSAGPIRLMLKFETFSERPAGSMVEQSGGKNDGDAC